MDPLTELLHGCRIGDEETVESVLNTPNLDINRTDEWDYSPLILASLCGHFEIVKMLLQRGAICDRDSFEGERCIYGALNDKIRDLLLSYDLSKKVDVNQPFASHITKILQYNKFVNKDIIITTKEDNRNDATGVRLNRFLLCARSEELARLVNGLWYDKVTIDDLEVSDKDIDFLVDYIYLRTDYLSVDRVIEFQYLAKKFGLRDVIIDEKDVDDIRLADDKAKAKLTHDSTMKVIEKSRNDMSKFLDKLIDSKVQVPLQLDDEIAFEDIEPSQYISLDLISQLLISDVVPDIILSIIDIETETIVYYPCHKCILTRSEYFETMFSSDIFNNKHHTISLDTDDSVIDRTKLTSSDIPVISITCTNSQVCELVLSYLYHDNVDVIPLQLTGELLYLSDELFLDKLKSLCAVNITSRFKTFTIEEMHDMEQRLGNNIFELIRISWATRCDKLEQHFSRFIAHNLKQIYFSTGLSNDLKLLVNESANRIENRQFTDTIELVDDIRYYLSKKYGVSNELFKDFVPVGPSLTGKFGEDTELRKSSLVLYNRDLEMIDDLLERLDLDA